MNSTLRSALRSIAAVVAGFAVIALGTILTFSVALGGSFGYSTSTALELLFGSAGALASGLAGGWVAAWVAARRPLLHAAALLVPIALDTASILASGSSTDPVWFDLGGSGILWLGALGGGYLRSRRAGRRSS